MTPRPAPASQAVSFKLVNPDVAVPGAKSKRLLRNRGPEGGQRCRVELRAPRISFGKEMLRLILGSQQESGSFFSACFAQSTARWLRVASILARTSENLGIRYEQLTISSRMRHGYPFLDQFTRETNRNTNCAPPYTHPYSEALRLQCVWLHHCHRLTPNKLVSTWKRGPIQPCGLLSHCRPCLFE